VLVRHLRPDPISDLSEARVAHCRNVGVLGPGSCSGGENRGRMTNDVRQ